MSDARLLLIATALKNFKKQGFHATGIDLILRESKVARKTLYRQFASKDALIVACLKQYNRDFTAWFVGSVARHSTSPAKRLEAVFDVAEEWFKQENFWGCIFIKASGEFPQTGSAIRKECAQFKQSFTRYLSDLANEAGLRRPEELGLHLALLFEGAIIARHVSQDRRAAARAKAAARVLIAAHRR